jgi:hypothetical protein
MATKKQRSSRSKSARRSKSKSKSKSKSARRVKRSKTHKRTHRGGSCCSAMPSGHNVFSYGGRRHTKHQYGGMSPITMGDDYLLDTAARVHAGVGHLDSSFSELPSVIPKQMGGGRHTKKSRREKRRTQRGGMSPYNTSSVLLSKGQYATDGTNDQFRTEHSVNPEYQSL